MKIIIKINNGNNNSNGQSQKSNSDNGQILELNINGRNVISTINSRAVSIVWERSHIT